MTRFWPTRRKRPRQARPKPRLVPQAPRLPQLPRRPPRRPPPRPRLNPVHPSHDQDQQTGHRTDSRRGLQEPSRPKMLRPDPGPLSPRPRGIRSLRAHGKASMSPAAPRSTAESRLESRPKNRPRGEPRKTRPTARPSTPLKPTPHSTHGHGPFQLRWRKRKRLLDRKPHAMRQGSRPTWSQPQRPWRR